MKLEVIQRDPRKQRFKTPLLFVHGTGHGAWCWDEFFLSYFAEAGFIAAAVSLRGHGGSEGRGKLKWTSISDYLEDVRSVADKLGTEPVIVGHSLGGLVAMKYLERYNAPAAVLVAPSPTEGMFRSGLKIQIRNPLLMTKVMLKQDYAVMFSTPRLAKKFLFSAEVEETRVAGYSARFGSESYLAALEMIFNLPRPKAISAPILVVGAENDALIVAKKIKRTAQALNADCRIFSGMAHDMMLEEGWKEVADHMIDWLKGKIS